MSIFILQLLLIPSTAAGQVDVKNLLQQFKQASFGFCGLFLQGCFGRLIFSLENFKTAGKRLLSFAVGQKAVVPDTLISFGKYVKQESPDELHMAQGHPLGFALVGVTAPFETDAMLTDVGDTVI